MNLFFNTARPLIALLLMLTFLNIDAQNILNKQEMLDRFSFWNNEDWEWYKDHIPFLETPDDEIDKTYYYRWELTTIHLVYGSPESGYATTEFIDRPWWSGAYGTISCPAGHQLYDFRWFRDPQYVKDYADFWFKNPGAQPHNYTNWIGDAVWQSYKVNRDFKWATNLLNDLKYDYYQWEKERWVEEEGMFAWDGMHDGMETNINSRQTPNWFNGAPGYRPTLNSYMWAQAKAIVEIASLLNDQATMDEFSSRAERIKSNFQEKCWDPSRNFFFHRFQNDELTVEKDDTIKANTLTYQSGKYEGSPHGRELIGFIPWYFNMPDEGYESAWQYLMDPEFFYAEFGPTVVEQNDPLFHISEHCCVWSGNSWPFGTSQTLKAFANLLNNYDQDHVSAEDYFTLFRNYALTHRKDGKPYIAEAVHPYTGSWEGHDNIGHSEHYSHSSYIDLVINDLIGLKPLASDSIEIDPLIPESWDYFCLDDVIYHGNQVSIVWDRYGTKYNAGKGLQVFSNGISIASSPTVEKIKVHLPFKPVPAKEPVVNYAVNNSRDYYPHAIASFPGIEHPYTKLNDGQFWYLESTTNQWSTVYSDAESHWCGIDFGAQRPLHTIKLYFIDDDDAISAPLSYRLEYWDGEDWLEIPDQKRNLAVPTGRRANTTSFPEIKTAKIRCVLHPKKGQSVGVSEIEAWGKPILPVKTDSNIETDNIAFQQGNTVSASYTSNFDNINGIIDGSINQVPRWTAFESPNKSDWVQIAFSNEKQVNTAYVYFFSDGAGVKLPAEFNIQYKDGKKWKDVGLTDQKPGDLTANSLNIFKFKPVNTTGIRLVFDHASETSFSGIYEVELYYRQ